MVLPVTMGYTSVSRMVTPEMASESPEDMVADRPQIMNIMPMIGGSALVAM